MACTVFRLLDAFGALPLLACAGACGPDVSSMGCVPIDMAYVVHGCRSGR